MWLKPPWTLGNGMAWFSTGASVLWAFAGEMMHPAQKMVAEKRAKVEESLMSIYAPYRAVYETLGHFEPPTKSRGEYCCARIARSGACRA